MSNRYNHNHNKHEGNNNNIRGFPKTQKKFVPKTPNSTSKEQQSDSNPTLSNSLRKSYSRQSDGPPSAAAAGSRVLMGGNGDWVSSSSTIHGGNFVNYLPQDEAVAAGLGPDEGGLDPVESQRVVDLLNRELSRLLKSSPRDFWKEVAGDTSLHAFLESFLKFRSRWYDFPYRGAKGMVAGVIVGEFELSRRVFMILYRISSHRDPGARGSDSLSPKDHAVLLQEKKLLDLPKLLDVCAIYGHENEDLTRILVMNAIRSQPRLQDELSAVISHFLGIMHTMYQRFSSSLEVLLSTQDHQGHGLSRLHTDYSEVMDFINDAVVSLDAFVNAYKHAAVYFSCTVEMSYGNEELLCVLARLHDSLLPSLHQGFRVIFAAGGNGQNDMSDGTLSNIAVSLKMLSARIVKFGWKLLYFCFLSDELFEESFLLPATKIFPAQVEDPVIKADILVQTFKDISRGHSHVAEGKTRATFLQNIEKNHKIMRRIELLRNTGWIVMDDEQIQFLSGIIMHPLEINNNEAINLSESVTSNRMQIVEDAAIVESKISQIKEIFPDYGDGFLSACLEVYNHNPEEVIQRILEGTLHEDLRSLDTSLPKIPPPKSALSVSKNDKGKGKLVDYTETIKVNKLPFVQEQQTEGSSLSSSASVGRYMRKSTADLSESDILDSRDKKNLVKTAALISQLEYEDEYDDSYDDLGLSVGDSGLEDAESLGDKVESNRGKQWEPGSGSSSSSVSNSNKWNSRKKPLFYVKDGKNYSYKVEGSIAVSNYNEATLVNQTQKELIHGLGRGGNFPLGAVKQLTKFSEEPNEEPNVVEGGGRGYPGNHRGRGRRGGGNLPWGAVKQSTKSSEEPDEEPNVVEGGGRGNSGSQRGRARRGGGRSHYRKDQAMRKHMSGLIGH